MKHLRLKRIVSIIILFTTIEASLYAQPNSAGIFDDTNDAPINGGLIVLFILGIGYGAYKLYRKNAKSQL